ncbi:hypothetical protein AAES_50671 [Amazona aestiva]|uniref:Uncharacterized protein n=1 Tax=Amazona aestiva TaxID=12930 RepID=A0A0Q3RF54_AMAAE|nr:hypothetical protein AAES_50671 [Amazona aestiva]
MGYVEMDRVMRQYRQETRKSGSNMSEKLKSLLTKGCEPRRALGFELPGDQSYILKVRTKEISTKHKVEGAEWVNVHKLRIGLAKVAVMSFVKFPMMSIYFDQNLNF